VSCIYLASLDLSGLAECCPWNLKGKFSTLVSTSTQHHQHHARYSSTSNSPYRRRALTAPWCASAPCAFPSAVWEDEKYLHGNTIPRTTILTVSATSATVCITHFSSAKKRETVSKKSNNHLLSCSLPLSRISPKQRQSTCQATGHKGPDTKSPKGIKAKFTSKHWTHRPSSITSAAGATFRYRSSSRSQLLRTRLLQAAWRSPFPCRAPARRGCLLCFHQTSCLCLQQGWGCCWRPTDFQCKLTANSLLQKQDKSSAFTRKSLYWVMQKPSETWTTIFHMTHMPGFSTVLDSIHGNCRWLALQVVISHIASISSLEQGTCTPDVKVESCVLRHLAAHRLPPVPCSCCSVTLSLCQTIAWAEAAAQVLATAPHPSGDGTWLCDSKRKPRAALQPKSRNVTTTSPKAVTPTNAGPAYSCKAGSSCLRSRHYTENLNILQLQNTKNCLSDACNKKHVTEPHIVTKILKTIIQGKRILILRVFQS